MRTADVIVIGLGAMGSAALYQLARRGVRVTGIDRFSPPHVEGSSHGETRITRSGVGEGPAYGPLVRRSHAIWEELEAETGEQLLRRCGFMLIDGSASPGTIHATPDFVGGTIASAREGGVAHEILDAAETRARFPHFLLRGDERVYYEPGGGIVFPERCIAAQLRLAEALGATIRRNETVLDVASAAGGVTVRTDRGVLAAGHVVMAAGGWLPGLVGAPLGRMRLLRQVLHWFAVDDPSRYAPDRSPSFIWVHDAPPHDTLYGFPIVPGLTDGLKVATEQYETAIATPDAIDRTVSDAETAGMFARHVSGRFAGVRPGALRSTACLYTNAPDGDFAIGALAEAPNVTIVSACSGHGFKHSAAVGELAAGIVLGERTADPAFALSRGAL